MVAGLKGKENKTKRDEVILVVVVCEIGGFVSEKSGEWRKTRGRT